MFTPRPLGPLYDIAAQLGGALDAALRNASSREAIFGTLLDELGPGRTPTVLVLEDVHWADEATLDLLKFLGRRAHRLPLLVIVTVRDDEIGPAHPLRSVLGDLPRGAVRRLELRPLSESAVATLARRAGRAQRGLHAATGGNPFYLSEVLASNQSGIPATVRDAVLGRASRASPEARAAMEVVSVIPGKAESWLVERLFGRDSAAVEECFSAGMLTSDQQGVGFRHELARRAVEESLVSSRRRGLHARVLAALETAASPVAPARLVHHAEGAGDTVSVQRWVPLAASQASALGAHREASAHYTVGLRSAEALAPDERATLLEGRSYEDYLIGRMAEAFAAREEALDTWRRLGDRRREGAALRWLSRLAWSGGRRADAERYAEEAIAVLEPLGLGPELAMAYSNLSQLHMLAGETEGAVTWGDKAIALAERLGDSETLVHALTNVGSAEIRSRPDEGYPKLTRALRLAREGSYQEHVSRCYANFTSFVADAEVSGGRALPARRAGVHRGTGPRFLDRVHARVASAAPPRHRGVGRGPPRGGRAAGADQALRSARIHVLVVLGLLRARCGQAGVSELLDEAHTLAESTAELQRLGPVALARAEAAWLARRPAEMAMEARAVYELSLTRNSPWIRGGLAVWLHRAGALPRVPEDIPRACLLELRGDAVGAAAEWARLGCPYEQALALAEADTPALVAEAVRLLEGLGAEAAVGVVRQRLEALAPAR